MFNSIAKVLRRCSVTNMDWIRLQPASHDDQLKALRTLKVAREQQTLDWLDVAGGTPLVLPGVLTLELTQARNLQLCSGVSD